MKLNLAGRRELRKHYETLLNEVNGFRIKIEKELLETLLFEYSYDEYHKIMRKLPVWSGKFLQKIDLSEISFEDVSWSTLDYIDEKYPDNEKFHLEEGKLIDYSNTNAHINFCESYDFKVSKYISIINCDFSGVDLSNNELGENIDTIDNCNLSNTNIIVSKDFAIECIFNTNLTGINLSSIGEIYPHNFVDGGHFQGCILTDTGVHFEIENLDSADFEGFAEFVKSGVVSGCYLGDKLINGKEYQEENHKNVLANYDVMRKMMLDNASQSVSNQIFSRTHKK